MITSLLTQRPIFLYSLNMLTAELRTNINKKWEACWPINMLRPLVLLDLISYLLFIKKLEERHLIAGATETFRDNLTPAEEEDELSWSRFKDMDAQSMHKLFTKEKGIPDLIKNYGHTNLQYSLFVKEPLLLIPTARLLANMVDIIKIMEAEDNDTRAAIFEYLLNKAEIAGQNGQVYAPDYVVKLIVALMKPTPEDLIGDPSAGNGSFLVNSAMYIANKNAATIPNFKNDSVADIYKGIESDLIQLRIGAMNMILHGIEDPKLESLNVFNKANLSLREQPTLILSNLFFEGTEDKMTVEANTLHTENRRQEIRFLNLILKNLKSGGRAAVIIREIILYDNKTEIKTIRQQIIDDHKLEAVISLPGKAGSLFSGACILIFSKPETNTTDKVWFYKMEGKEGINKKDADSIHPGKNEAFAFIEEYDDVPDILTRWKNEKEETGRRTDKSFYVPVEEIKNNNYNLSFNEYRKSVKEPELYTRNEASPGKETAPRITIQKQAEPNVKKIKLSAQVAPLIRRRSTIFAFLIVICLLVPAFYFIYFKNKNDNPVATTANNTVSTDKIKPGQPTHNLVKNTPVAGMLSPEQIKAILKDTTGIIHFQNEDNDRPASIKGSRKELAKSNNTVILVGKSPGKIPEPGTSENALKVQYTVTDTTFFHDQPDESTRRKTYLDPLNNNVLNPIHDRNGFIYIIYTNRFGRTSKGWINKKDLRPLR